MYGQSQSKRSNRCFVFVLEDKTGGEEFSDNHKDEYGVFPERLYGICVVHSRIISKQTAAGKIVRFSADVCYAFITRFPLFEIFFQAIWDILSSERLARMQTLSDFGESDPNCIYLSLHIPPFFSLLLFCLKNHSY